MNLHMLSKFNFSSNKATFKNISPSLRLRMGLVVLANLVLTIIELLSLALMAHFLNLAISEKSAGVLESTWKNVLPSGWQALSPTAYLLHLGLLYLAIVMFRIFLSALMQIWYTNTLSKDAAETGNRLFSNIHTNHSDLIKFDKSQEILNGVGSGMDALVIGKINALVNIMIESIMLLCFGFFLFLADTVSTIMIFVLFTAAALIQSRFSNRIAWKSSQAYVVNESGYNRRVLDSFLVHRELRLRFSLSDLINNVNNLRFQRSALNARIALVPQINKYVTEFLGVTIAAAVLLVQISTRDLRDAISGFLIVLIALSRIVPSTLRLQNSVILLRVSQGKSHFASHYLDKTNGEEIQDYESRKCKLETVGDFVASMEFTDVSYTYPGNYSPSIKSLNLEINPGEFVAIVGKSGSGKTTILELMLGFLSPQSGIVQISNENASSAIKRWPGKVAYVPQDVSIIQGSVASNIALDPVLGINEEKIWDCLKMVRLDEDVENLSNGLDEYIGERGLKLSGGQKQRLGIARALYTDPEILILDEATSSLDAQTENEVSSAVYSELRSRKMTVVVVTHRLSTIVNANRILYIENGTLINQGTFDFLKENIKSFSKQVDLSEIQS